MTLPRVLTPLAGPSPGSDEDASATSLASCLLSSAGSAALSCPPPQWASLPLALLAVACHPHHCSAWCFHDADLGAAQGLEAPVTATHGSMLPVPETVSPSPGVLRFKHTDPRQQTGSVKDGIFSFINVCFMRRFFSFRLSSVVVGGDESGRRFRVHDLACVRWASVGQGQSASPRGS